MRHERHLLGRGVQLIKVAVVLALWCGAPALLGSDYVFPEAYWSELRQAWQCYTNADATNSLAHYRAAIRLAPESLEARLGCLSPLLALERFAEAESLASRIVHQYPANYYANLRLAYALRLQGKLAPAETVLNRMLPLRPTDVPLLLELALVKLAARQNATARQLFLEVLTLAPGDPVALQKLALPQLLGEPRDAVAREPLPAFDGWFDPGAARRVSAESTVYYGWMNYHDTAAKDHSQVLGLYASLAYGPEHLVEAEEDYLNKFYRGFTSLHQWDTTVTYANLSLPHLKLRLGGHYVDSDDPYTDQGWVAFAGVEYYVATRWAAGVDAYFTDYPKFQNKLEVGQLTPHLDLTLWRGAHHTWYNDLRGYWIHLNHEFDGRQDLFSLEDRLSLNWRRWTVSLYGWAGEQLFAVRNDGFALFNLGERHQAGYGLELRYALSTHLALALRASREEFRDLATTPHASSDMYLAMLSLQF